MLVSARGTPVERVENQHDIFLSCEIGKLHVFLTLIFQCEIRRRLTYRYAHDVPFSFQVSRKHLTESAVTGTNAIDVALTHLPPTIASPCERHVKNLVVPLYLQRY